MRNKIYRKILTKLFAILAVGCGGVFLLASGSHESVPFSTLLQFVIFPLFGILLFGLLAILVHKNE